MQQVTGRGVKTGPNLALLLEILKAQSLATPKRVWDLRQKSKKAIKALIVDTRQETGGDVTAPPNQRNKRQQQKTG